MKSSIYVFVLLFFVVLLVGKASGACVTPVENLEANESMTLCVGTYYLNDTDGNGVLNLSTSNVVIDGNGTIFVGDLNFSHVSMPFQSLTFAKINITLKNINFINYTVGNITLGTAFTFDNVNIKSNNNFRQYGITNILNSILQLNDSVQRGALYVSNAGNNNIWVNCVNSTLEGANGGYGFQSIHNNNITLSGCIIQNYTRNYNFQNSSSSSVYNNQFKDARVSISTIIANSVYFDMVRDFLFYNNTIDGSMYNGTSALSIAYFTGSKFNQSYNVSIYNNFVKNGAGNCFHLNTNYSENVRYYNNEHINCSIGIDISHVHGAEVYNNTYSNITGYGIRVWSIMNVCNLSNTAICTTTNANIYQNKFYDIDLSEYIIYGITSGTNISNNTYDRAPKITVFNNETPTNFTFDESISGLNISYWADGTTPNIQILMNYVGRHYLNIYNSTLNIYNQLIQYPYNDVFNVSTASILASNVDNYSISLSSGQSIIVGNYSSLSYSFSGFGVSGESIIPGYIYGSLNISDPDSLFNNVSVILYDSTLTVLNNSVSRSLNTFNNFTNLSEGTYYGRIIIYLNDSSTVNSGLSSVIRVGTGSANCTNSEHQLWRILPLIILAGFLMYLLTQIELGIFGTIGFLITLVIELQLIASLITTILASC